MLNRPSSRLALTVAFTSMLVLLLVASFLPEPSTTQWNDANSGPIDFERGVAGEILLPVFADGIDIGPCILDTGTQSGAIFVASEVTDDAQLRRALWPPWSLVSGSSGTVLRANHVARDVQLGPLTLSKLLAVELPELGRWRFRQSGEGVGSICGNSFLESVVVDIRWGEQRIILHDQEVEEDLAWNPLEVHGSLPYVHAAIEGEIEGLFLLDTGSSKAVSLEPHVLRDHESLGSLNLTSGVGLGVGGEASVQFGVLSEFQLAGRQFRNLRAEFSTVPVLGEPYLGIIGLPILETFRIVIDKPRNRIAFVPLDQAPF